MSLPYTQAESDRASKEWKASCGHHSIAAATSRSLDAVKNSGIKLCGWMNPTMVTQCLRSLGVAFESLLIPYDPGVHPFAHMVFEKSPVRPRIFRVQFEGPWMKGPIPGRYRQTHYIASLEQGVVEPIYEPAEIMEHADWLDLADHGYKKCIKNCTGYHFTHVWEILI